MSFASDSIAVLSDITLAHFEHSIDSNNLMDSFLLFNIFFTLMKWIFADILYLIELDGNELIVCHISSHGDGVFLVIKQ